MIKMNFGGDKERQFEAQIILAHDNIILWGRALECWNEGYSFYDIDPYEDEDPDWCDDWSDDVDESNYDPYLGCDFYEPYDYDLSEWQFT